MPRYRYCSGASFTVAVAPLLLIEKNDDGSNATFFVFSLALRANATISSDKIHLLGVNDCIVLELKVSFDF